MIAKIEAGKVDLPRTKIIQFADVFGISPTELMGLQYSLTTGIESVRLDFEANGKKFGPKHYIPVLGTVQAGIPIEVVEDIIDYEELHPSILEHGEEYFALQVKGDSMQPRMRNGDVVIVRKQSDVDHDDTAIVLVNGNEATIKRVLKSEAGIMLAPNNPAFEPKFYSNKEIEELPVQIIGKVIELRAKF
jgi:repressor LexA